MKKSITIRLLAFFMLIGGLCLVKAAPAQASVSGDAGKRRRDIQCVL